MKVMQHEQQPIAVHAGKREYLSKLVQRRYKSSGFRITWKNWADGTASIKVYLVLTNSGNTVNQ
jgi:hypothetical protein